MATPTHPLTEEYKKMTTRREKYLEKEQYINSLRKKLKNAEKENKALRWRVHLLGMEINKRIQFMLHNSRSTTKWKSPISTKL